jgi:hypothetical protein
MMGFDAGEASLHEEEEDAKEDSGAMEVWKKNEKMGFEGKATR